jgi:hypothetical protein
MAPNAHTHSLSLFLMVVVHAYQKSDRSFIAPPCLFACHPLQTLRIFNIKIMIMRGGRAHAARPRALLATTRAPPERSPPSLCARSQLGLEFFIIFANTAFVPLVNIYLRVPGRRFSANPAGGTFRPAFDKGENPLNGLLSAYAQARISKSKFNSV